MYKFTQNYIKSCELLLAALLLISGAGHAATPPPVLNFSDLTNGPASGLNDGLGQGTLVTVWGNKLGSTQGASKVYFKDASDTVTEAAYVYYWKNADGNLPGGPANLYDSHQMQEIAFSIPNAIDGNGVIYVEVDGVQSNTLPFKVRAGNIYHVKTSGDNATGNGSWNAPWQTGSQDTNGAFKKISGGDIIYAHDGVTDSNLASGGRGLYLSGKPGTLDAQTAYVAYPNSTVKVEGDTKGVAFYLTDAVVIAKIHSYVGNYPEPAPDSNVLLAPSGDAAMQTTANGRLIGNKITDIPGTCTSSQAGAISAGMQGGYDYVSNLKVFGNYIYEFGCNQTSKFAHTTYFTNRSTSYVTPAITGQAFEVAWNHLLDNHAKYGLHTYDEIKGSAAEKLAKGCGDFDGTIKIHDNVVRNQRGAGISIGAANTEGLCWDTPFEIYNNIVVNAGLGPEDLDIGGTISPHAIQIRDIGLASQIDIYNNTLIGWSNHGSPGYDGGAIGIDNYSEMVQVTMRNNIIYSEQDHLAFYIRTPTQPNVLQGQNNIWYYTGTSPTKFSTPAWDSAPVTQDPLITLSSGHYLLDKNSPAVDASMGVVPVKDVFGLQRSFADIGAVEYLFLDSDSDSITDNIDNCPLQSNLDQADFDNDGMGDVCDDNDDNDAALDVVDDFPFDSSETKDTDGDGVGDNADAFPNNSAETKDSDGDGVGDNADAFPNNSAETKDSDGDGVGDNADAFPYNSAETKDSDGDGVGDNADAFPNNNLETKDSDGDGVGDNADAFPNNNLETKDSDGDGVGDNADAFPNNGAETKDSDGDGVGDNTDAFPNNANEIKDTDGDGVGDNSDAFPTNAAETADSDADGVGDNADAFPNDPDETIDSDGDGVGDNADFYPDDATRTTEDVEIITPVNNDTAANETNTGTNPETPATQIPDNTTESNDMQNDTVPKEKAGSINLWLMGLIALCCRRRLNITRKC